VRSSDTQKRPLSLGRLWDGLAALAIAFALWKIFIAPRSFAAPVHPAPHAVYPRLAGGIFRVADERGRVVFLDFYASWCEPCKAELPLVESWWRGHRAAVVVPVDVGEPRSVAASFARRFSLANVALDPQNSAPALFGIQGFPTVVVIDSNGKVRAKWEGLNPAIGLAMSNAYTHL
jgi:thiol-disulfide isomerase/thioredoxin